MTGITGAVMMFVLYCFATKGWMVFAIMLLTPAQSLVMPALGAMMSRRVAGNAQGELQGFNGSVASVAAILAPAIYTPAIARFISPDAPFRFPAIGFAIAAAIGCVALAILASVRRADQIPSATPS